MVNVSTEWKLHSIDSTEPKVDVVILPKLVHNKKLQILNLVLRC